MSHFRPPFRADVVGSLLRPAPLLEAMNGRTAASQEGVSTNNKTEALIRLEDAAIKDALKLQEDAGLEVVTDGEFRRQFYFDLLASFHGIELKPEEGYSFVSGFSPPRAFVVDKIGWPEDGVSVADFRFAASHTRKCVKVTLPSPLFSQFYNKDRVDRSIYPDRDQFWEDLIGAYKKEIGALADAGCSYIQIDETTLIRLCDPKFVSYLNERGVDPDAEFEHWINVLDAITDGAPPNVTLAMHICRGNGPAGSWISSGGYEPIADAVFNRVGVDMYLLEFDNERSGGFEPLRFVPPNKGVVLGLITTKSPILESIDQLKRRVDQASQFIAHERLAISPQCGFSSDTIDRPLDEHDQLKKLRLVAHAASEIWGD